MKISVAVFAHNEQDNICRAIGHLLEDLEEFDYSIHVLANGCKDRTADEVRWFFCQNENIYVHEIELGDKANAWNYFIHEVKDEADFFVFTDGDCWVNETAIRHLVLALIINPNANASSGIYALDPDAAQPWSLYGNLYALPKSFVSRIRSMHFKMPIGLVGDDSNIGHLALLDLNNNDTWDYSKLIVCHDALFYTDRKSPFSFNYWKNQYSRKIRYSRRYFENKMFDYVLKHEGLQGVPETVNELYKKASHICKLEWAGIDTPYHYLALNQIKEKGE